MNWVLLVAYALTILGVFLPITSIPTSIIGGLFGRLINNYLLGMVGGSLIVWFVVDLIWTKYTNGHIPVLAFGICFLSLTVNAYLERHRLNQNAKWMIAAEQWALVLFCGYLMIVTDPIRWY